MCADIGAALADLPLPVSDDESRDAAASVTTAALLALYKAGTTPMEWEGDVPPHRSRVMTGAVRLSLDESSCEALVDQYFEEVALLLASAVDLVNAQLTATSLFFTAIAHGTVKDVSPVDQVELIGGLRWLLDGITQTAEGAPDPDDAAITDTADADVTHKPLADFVGSVVSQHPGFVAAEQTSEHRHAWLVAQGSVLTRIEAIQDHEQAATVRFSVPLLRDVRMSSTLLETLNIFNARDWFFKAYAENDSVHLEYVQVAEELTEGRLVYTLRLFIQTADELDSMLQDRFGGMTYAADVKAQFSV